MTEAYQIRKTVEGDEERFFNHLRRHMDESGNGTLIFHPTDKHKSWTPEEQIPIIKKRWATPTTQVGWEVVWVVESGGEFVGHLNLRSAQIETALHRSYLGMGLEKSARGRGLGQKLLEQAITWAKRQASIDWIDLDVFEHNKPARKLYEHMGFKVTGQRQDAFRVQGEIVHDLHMCLAVSN